MKKGILCAAAAMAMLMAVPAQAGTWHLGTGANAGRYWYGDAANYLRSGWYWVDGNADGIAERYYFDNDGWLLVNGTAPDGATANENGAWVVNGVVQIIGMRKGPANDLNSNGYGGPGGGTSRTVTTPPAAAGREDLSGYAKAEYWGGSWRKIRTGEQYYVDSEGNRVRNTLAKIDGEYYLLGTAGYMMTGWRFVDGHWYYFFVKNDLLREPEGKAARNMYVGSYHMNEEGQWDNGV